MQRNYHSGGTVADETPKVARVAHVEVMNEPAHPTFLEVPLGESTSMANPSVDLHSRANQLHHSLLTVDTHCDTPLLLRGGFDLGRRHAPGRITEGQQDFVRMKEGGLAASFFAVFTSQGPLDEAGRSAAFAEARKGLESVEAALRKGPELAEKALTPKDARRIHASGKRAIFLALENGYPIGKDIAKVDTFHALGVRYITLAHNKDNDLCASATDRGKDGEKPDTGLSAFGREVLCRMNALGILVDISHISPRSVADVLQVSKAPVLASHSACRALCDNPRNLSDDQLRAIRDRGGVMQIGMIADFLKPMPSYPERSAALDAFWNKLDTYFDGSDRNPARAEALEREWAALQQRFPPPTVTVKDLVDHIDHAVKTIGIDHVGIGTDFDGGGGLTDCNDVTEFPRVTEELLRRGYSESDIRKIWGGNVMRVMEAAQKATNPRMNGTVNLHANAGSQGN